MSDRASLRRSAPRDAPDAKQTTATGPETALPPSAGCERAGAEVVPGGPETPSASPADAASPTANDAPRRRFGWLLRLALSLAVFDMLFRSLVSLAPFDDDWRKELKIARLPLGLPTVAERARIKTGSHKTYASLNARYQAVGRSLVRYFNPIPSKKSRRQIRSATDRIKYAATWTGTRLNFWGTLLGIDQKWTMFSPNVSKKGKATRALLHYDDDTTQQVRFLTEPRDATSFFRWFNKRPLKFQSRIHRDKRVRRGMNNYLRERYARNGAGAALTSIAYHKAIYPFPKAGRDARRFFQQSKGAKLRPAYYRYDIERNKERWLEKKNKKKSSKSGRAKRRKKASGYSK